MHVLIILGCEHHIGKIQVGQEVSGSCWYVTIPGLYILGWGDSWDT